MLAELGISDGRMSDGGVSGAQARVAATARDGAGYACRCPECVDAQWNIRRLKYWLAARLLANGADEAEVDKWVGNIPVDIYWRIDDRQFAIEVRSGPLDRESAQQHTRRLRGVGCDGVLWLCAPGYWVAHLPALGIADFAPPACDYLIDVGMLDAKRSAVAVPQREPFELRDFLQGWVAGDIAWGYRDLMTGGWATMTDWEHHTRTQASIIARQRQELVNQRTTLALSRKSVRDKQKQITKLSARLGRAEESTQELADSLAEAHRKLADHNRVDTSLRATIVNLQQTISHWQLVTCSAMMLIVTFVAGAIVVR
jgi:hypothetical protein